MIILKMSDFILFKRSLVFKFIYKGIFNFIRIYGAYYSNINAVYHY